VPAGQVNDVDGAFALAERLGLDPIVEIADGLGHSTRLPRSPVRMAATPSRYETPPPRLGELDPEAALDLAEAVPPRSGRARSR
jgi:crotonobetainyl-CoA:carnitine CoA-transferase CaiB-like acyl-CoA transferase